MSEKIATVCGKIMATSVILLGAYELAGLAVTHACAILDDVHNSCTYKTYELVKYFFNKNKKKEETE